MILGDRVMWWWKLSPKPWVGSYRTTARNPQIAQDLATWPNTGSLCWVYWHQQQEGMQWEEPYSGANKVICEQSEYVTRDLCCIYSAFSECQLWKVIFLRFDNKIRNSLKSEAHKLPITSKLVRPDLTFGIGSQLFKSQSVFCREMARSFFFFNIKVSVCDCVSSS